MKKLKRILLYNINLHDIRYYGFYIWWNWLTDLKWRIPNYFERAYYGVGHADVWNFDQYLAKIFIRGLSQLKKYNHGIPSIIYKKYKDRKDLTLEQKDKQSSKEWENILNEMIKGFEAVLRLENTYNHIEYNIIEKELKKALDLLKIHYLSLWD
jgi:hypothetical protein